MASISRTGQSTGSKPSARNADRSGPACARGRVTITRTSGGDERHQRRRDFAGIGTGPPLEPAAILGCDQAGQTLTVVIRRYGRETAATDHRDASPLGFHAGPRFAVVCSCDQVLLAGAHLHCERTLPGLRQERAGLEPMTDLGSEPEPVETASREHDRIEPALPALAQTRLDVTAKWLDRERRLDCEELCAPADRCRTDPQPGPKPRHAAQRVAGILALEVRTDGQALRVGRGHVLRGMHRDVDASVEECLFEFLDEDAARTDLPERAPAITIARGRDRHKRDLDAGPAQSGCRELGLRE